MKRYLCVVPLSLLFCFTFACRDKAAKAELEKFQAQAKLEEQNTQVIRDFFAAIDNNDFDKLRKLATDDFSIRAPGLIEPWHIDAVVQVIKTHYASFPDWKHKIEDVVAEGDKVAVRLAQTGIHKAPYEGIAPTEKTVVMPALVMITLENGRVKEFWAVENYLDFYQQLGMELKPKEAEKK
jgi:predicted ester cyclase